MVNPYCLEMSDLSSQGGPKKSKEDKNKSFPQKIQMNGNYYQKIGTDEPKQNKD